MAGRSQTFATVVLGGWLVSGLSLAADEKPVDVPAQLAPLTAAETPAQSAPASPQSTLPTPTIGLGMRFDCSHNFNSNKGAAQNCLGISGLRFDVNEQMAPNLHARLRLDPFSTPRPSREDLALRAGLPTTNDTALGIVDEFAVVWSARPSLDLAVQTYDGAAMPISVSGLAMANSFMDAGWKQLALTINYKLTFPMPMEIGLIAGDGEGETVKSTTPQEYFGFTYKASLFKGLQLLLGASVNGNDAGTEEYNFVTKQYATTCGIPVSSTSTAKGHGNRRTAAGLVFDGDKVGANGLKVGLAWQSNIAKDLSKDSASYPLMSQLQQSNCQLDPDFVFPERQGVLSSTRRTSYDVSLQYHLHNASFIGADFTMRKLTADGSEAFHLCDAYANNQCAAIAPGDTSSVQQTAWTVGAGTALAQGLEMSLEYFSATYDKSYAQLYYAGAKGKASKDLAVFNARLAYRWQ